MFRPISWSSSGLHSRLRLYWTHYKSHSNYCRTAVYRHSKFGSVVGWFCWGGVVGGGGGGGGGAGGGGGGGGGGEGRDSADARDWGATAKSSLARDCTQDCCTILFNDYFMETTLRAGRSGVSNPGWYKRLFSSPKTSRPALRPTQPHIQYVPRFLLLG